MSKINNFESLKRLERTINQDYTYDIFIEEIKSQGDDCYMISINGNPIFMQNYEKCYKFLTLLCEGEQV